MTLAPSPAIVARIEGPELARVVGNAVPFLPARSRFKRARLYIDSEFLSVLVTDGHTAASDHAPLEGRGKPLVVEVDLDGLKAIDKAGRDGKKGYVEVEVFPGDCLRVTDIEGVTTAVPCFEPDTEMWDAVHAAFDRVQAQQPSLPQTVCIDPALLMRFSKIKCDKAERMADFLIRDPDSPILVKVGPTFVGIIMPVSRDVQEEVGNGDGLWD